MALSFKAEVEIIYRYIVEGISVNNIDEQMGLNPGTASKTITECGFNKNKTTGWKKGEHNGKYRPGSPACKGVRVDRNVIADYLDDLYGWEKDFEWYIDEISKDIAAEREEEYRRFQEQQRREQEQRERAARAAASIEEAKRQRQIEEQNAKIAQQKAQQDYKNLVNRAKALLDNGKTQDAYNLFLQARNCINTVETSWYLAKILATAQNASQHANSILTYLREYREYLENNNKSFSAQECLWYAEACLGVGFKSDACDYFYYAGDIFYDQKNYKKAAEIYFDANRRTGYWSSNSYAAPFRMAYSFGKKENMTTEDIKSCIFWYEVAIKNNKEKVYAYGNISYWYMRAGRYDDAIEAAQTAIGLGLKEAYVYQNLLSAQIKNGDADNALETMDKMDALGFSYQPWQRGDALFVSDKHDNIEAVPYFEQQLKKDPLHEESIVDLLLMQEENVLIKAVPYALRYLELGGKGNYYNNIVNMAISNAKIINDNASYIRLLEFSSEEKKKYNEEKARKKVAEAERQQIEENRQRAEEERRAELERKIREEAKKKAAEEQQRLKEQERLLEEKRQEELRKIEQKRREEEILLLF